MNSILLIETGMLEDQLKACKELKKAYKSGKGMNFCPLCIAAGDDCNKCPWAYLADRFCNHWDPNASIVQVRTFPKAYARIAKKRVRNLTEWIKIIRTELRRRKRKSNG